MKTATPFHSDFFNAGCLNAEGETGFSLTGGNKVLYPSTGNLRPIKGLLSKVCGPNSSSSASDLSEFPGTCVVQTITGKGKKEEALFISRDTFVLMLKVASKATYRGEPTAGALYAQEMMDRLVGQSIQLILDREAGLLKGKTADEAVRESILRSEPDNSKAYDGAAGIMVQAMWESYSCTNTPVPKFHPSGFGSQMSFLWNRCIYARLCPEFRQMGRVRAVPSKSIWSHLPDEYKEALTPVLLYMAARIKSEGWHNIEMYAKEADQFWPRFNQGYKVTPKIHNV